MGHGVAEPKAEEGQMLLETRTPPAGSRCRDRRAGLRWAVDVFSEGTPSVHPGSSQLPLGSLATAPVC